MARIFISYRRADSTQVTSRIYDRLTKAFGNKDVFKDVDSILPGENFVDKLNITTTNCRVMLVIIGPQWLDIRDDKGTLRLADAGDFVRLEVENGLQREKMLLIPVLVEKATMPTATELPFSLQGLAEIHGFRIRDDPDFHEDVDKLIKRVQTRVPTLKRRRRYRRWIASLMLIFLIVAAIGLTQDATFFGFRAPVTQIAALPTPTETTMPTLTPTETPTPAPTFTALESAVQRARDFTGTNANWEPFESEFGAVTMVLVPQACFMMGSDFGDPDEMPIHEQCFDAPFWISKYEITNAQYGSSGAFSGDEYPRDNVTWEMADTFCRRSGLRLPTEREWEFSARGPENLIYPWGNVFYDTHVIYYLLADESIRSGPDVVGSRPLGVSWVGAYDLSGNLWEWTSSIYNSYPYDATVAERPNSETAFYTLRGGHWGGTANRVRAANRFGEGIPITGLDGVGFRCARDVDG